MATSPPAPPEPRPRPQAGGEADLIGEILLGPAGAPPPELDRYLDALATCVARSGLRRTSVQDVARLLGVDRTTVYRQVGPVNRQLRLLAARDIARAVALLPDAEHGPVSPADVTAAMGAVVELARAHPVLARVREEDSDLITLADLQAMQAVFARVADVLAPRLAEGMRRGWFAERDPLILATWLVSTTVWLVFMPPLADVDRVLGELVAPMLEP